MRSGNLCLKSIDLNGPLTEVLIQRGLGNTQFPGDLLDGVEFILVEALGNTGSLLSGFGQALGSTQQLAPPSG